MSETLLNKLLFRINRLIACSLALAVRGGFSLPWDRRPSVYTPYPCGDGRRDRYGNSSNHSLSERYTLRRPYRRYLPLPCWSRALASCKVSLAFLCDWLCGAVQIEIILYSLLSHKTLQSDFHVVFFSFFYTFFFRSWCWPRASNVQLLVLHGLYLYLHPCCS